MITGVSDLAPGDSLELEGLGSGEVLEVGRVVLAGYMSVKMKIFSRNGQSQPGHRLCAFWVESGGVKMTPELLEKRLYVDLNSWGTEKFQYKIAEKEE